MYSSAYFYRGLKKNSFSDELPYRLLETMAFPVNHNSIGWSSGKGNYRFRPKKTNGKGKDKPEQHGIMAQLIYYGEVVFKIFPNKRGNKGCDFYFMKASQWTFRDLHFTL